MIQKDYIMRIVERFAQSLTVILKLKEQGEIEHLQENLDEAFKEVSGFAQQDLLNLPITVILESLHHYSDDIDARVSYLVQLLYEQGELHEHIGNVQTAQKCFNQALLLVDQAGLQGPISGELIHELLEKTQASIL